MQHFASSMYLYIHSIQTMQTCLFWLVSIDIAIEPSPFTIVLAIIHRNHTLTGTHQTMRSCLAQLLREHLLQLSRRKAHNVPFFLLFEIDS